MAKLIKFDLPINGIKARNLDELRENITSELLTFARNGLLLRWLTSRSYQAEAEAIQAIRDVTDDIVYFIAICNALSVEVLTAEAEAILLPPPLAGRPLAEDQHSIDLHEVKEKTIAVIDRLIEIYKTRNVQSSWYPNIWLKLLSERDRLTNSPAVDYIVNATFLEGNYIIHARVGDTVQKDFCLITNGGRWPNNLLASVEGTVVFQEKGTFVLSVPSSEKCGCENQDALQGALEFISLSLKNLG